VALFITCLTDQFYPQVGIAITKILEHYGCRVSFPRAQTCCGQPFFNNGFHPETRALAERMVDLFADCDYVVTPSGSCCAMVREHYPHLLAGGEWEAKTTALCAKTYEFVEFLTRVLKADLSGLSLPKPQTITYHYTCHLRGLGIRDEAVLLLRQLGNVQFTPLEKTDQCCGFGGTFAVKYPAISGAIVADKARCIADTRARTTVCNEAGCTMNITGMCHRQDIPTTVRHFAELLAEALGIDFTRW
jgi:L-lactate dehydrogenase complex protein LldE